MAGYSNDIYSVFVSGDGQVRAIIPGASVTAQQQQALAGLTAFSFTNGQIQAAGLSVGGRFVQPASVAPNAVLSGIPKRGIVSSRSGIWGLAGVNGTPLASHLTYYTRAVEVNNTGQTITDISLFFDNVAWIGPNESAGTSGEAPGVQTVIVQGCIEYPQGNYIPVHFSGQVNAQGNPAAVLTPYDSIESDITGVQIPNGATYGLYGARTCVNTTTGISPVATISPGLPYGYWPGWTGGNGNAASGGYNFDDSATPAQPHTISSWLNTNIGGCGPVAVLGNTATPISRFCHMGMSIPAGIGSSATNGQLGWPAMGPLMFTAGMNMSMAGDALKCVAPVQLRRVRNTYFERFGFTHVCLDQFTNDVLSAGGTTPAVALQNAALMVTALRAMDVPYVGCATLTPYTTNATSGIPIGNGVAFSQQINQPIRGLNVGTGLDFYLPIEECLSTFRDSCVWGNNGWTADGRHMVDAGHQKVGTGSGIGWKNYFTLPPGFQP